MRVTKRTTARKAMIINSMYAAGSSLDAKKKCQNYDFKIRLPNLRAILKFDILAQLCGPCMQFGGGLTDTLDGFPLSILVQCVEGELILLCTIKMACNRTQGLLVHEWWRKAYIFCRPASQRHTDVPCT